MIARVFARKTEATPIDDLAFWGNELPLIVPEVEEVHICWVFTYDEPRVEYLAKLWGQLGVPVRIGGPATGEPGGDFIPGMYLKLGYVITSRGCPNRCPRCLVWIREGMELRELLVTEGWNVLDDNLLACSPEHIREVWAMLKRRPKGTRVEFTGGLEAARLERWHVDMLVDLKPKSIFFAYDDADDYEPLVMAGRMLDEAGIAKTRTTGRIRSSMRAYVLIGYPGDTIAAAETRLYATIRAGFLPMAMLYRDTDGKQSLDWERFQRWWARAASVAMKARELGL